MARMKKAESTLLILAIVIGIPIWLVWQLGESVGWLPLVIMIIAAFVLYFWYKAHEKAERRIRLMEKYDDAEIVGLMMSSSVWEGQTAEQVIDSIGKPASIDEKVLKTKKKEVWKYHHQGANRYGLRVTLDDDVVVGWDKRD